MDFKPFFSSVWAILYQHNGENPEEGYGFVVAASRIKEHDWPMEFPLRGQDLGGEAILLVHPSPQYVQVRGQKGPVLRIFPLTLKVLVPEKDLTPERAALVATIQVKFKAAMDAALVGYRAMKLREDKLREFN